MGDTSVKELADLNETAWGIIANASDWDMGVSRGEWIKAAERWRDQWFKSIKMTDREVMEWALLNCVTTSELQVKGGQTLVCALHELRDAMAGALDTPVEDADAVKG